MREAGLEVRSEDERGAATLFWSLWSGVLAVKVAIASALPLFVDEAFYWQEGQHPAAAYSDLPGLTAWLIRLGVEVGGHHALAVRAPFLLLAALVPLLVVRIARREYGGRAGWTAGCFALLLPLSGTLGLLALPDPVMAVATLLCADAGARLLRRVGAGAALELAAGLALGALSHYRFIAVIGVGLVALLLLPDGRRVLRDPRVWVAIALGAFAWAPLIAWNLDNADAGLRFQLVDRHPWAFNSRGVWFIGVQALLVSPLLFLALGHAAVRGLRSAIPASRYFALLGALVVAGFFILGFFADVERVSFHWPLPGYLALLPLLPLTLARWPRWARVATWALSALALVATLAYYVAVSIPAVRTLAAAEKWYPSNFAGWDALSAAVRDELRRMPAGTRVVADNFKIGAELGFALGRADVLVLDHPLNRKHGRAPQLELWGLHAAGRDDPRLRGPVLLVVGAGDVKFRQLLDRYQWLCERFGPLPAPRVVNADHGAQRFVLLPLRDAAPSGPCVTPALAYIVEPEAGARVSGRFVVRGWAVKDHLGVASVTVTLDGRPVAEADYGRVDVWPQRFLGGRSRDPNQPRIAFRAVVDASALPPGRHWVGLRIVGADGSVEPWAERMIEIAPSAGAGPPR